jgi:hypothetical protein
MMHFELRVLCLSAVLATSLLAACGGGEGEGTEGSSSTGTAISGTILASGSSTVQPVGMAGGEVAFTVGNSRYVAPVDQNGHFSLDFGGGLKGAPQWIAGTYHKDGYRTQTINLRVNNGMTSTVPLNIDAQPLTAIDVLTTAQIGKPWELTHLGDDNFTGSTNSQLQVSSQGLRWAARVEAVTAAQLYDYPAGICVTLDARGVDRTDSKIIFEGETVPLWGSPADGSFGRQTHCFNTKPGTHVSGSSLAIESKATNGDYDDFEFINVTVAFSTRLPKPPIATLEMPAGKVTGASPATFKVTNIAAHLQNSVKSYEWDFDDGSAPLTTTTATASYTFGSDWAFHQARVALKDGAGAVLGTLTAYVQANPQPNKIAGFSINAAVDNQKLNLKVGLGTTDVCGESYLASWVVITLPDGSTINPSSFECRGSNFILYFNNAFAPGGIIAVAKENQLSGTIPAAAGQPASSCYEYARNYCRVYPGW